MTCLIIYNRKEAFTLVEIMIVIAIVGLLASIAVPNFLRARIQAQQTACINNLRQIDSGKQQWALETRQQSDALPTETDVLQYIGRLGASNVVCPSGGITATFQSSYEIGVVSNAPTCKILPLTHVYQ